MGSATGHLPLVGTRVLELGHIVAGPTAALILADLGADVVKIERPDGGDQARRMSGNGSVFHFLNRNKRSVIVDLKADAGKEVFRRLVRTADIVLDNYAPGVLERLRLGYDDLAVINPRLIYLSLKGFLPGPYEHRPSLDELAQMMGGLAYMTGPRGQPLRAGASIIDIGAATYGVIGVLAALHERERTGRGEMLVAGLYETSVFWVGQWMVAAAMSGEPSVPMPEAGQSVRMGWGIFHLFPTADAGEQVFIAVTSNAHWERFCGALDLPDLLADANLDTNLKRVAARPWLLPRVREETAKYPSAALLERLERAGVPCGPVRRPDQLLDDSHLQATEQLLSVPLPGGGTAPLPKLPFRSSRYAFALDRPPPGLGEHTREVLAEAGLSQAEIDALEAQQAIVAGAPFDRGPAEIAAAPQERDAR
ncbi:MAG TPA: CaiB/BaiF CoA-transferase family protein [Chloroflexota bacterium]|jgi:crotonobetainyl-CoA:carnitine CoA-transferase CaiB-like acyl-CoA transferase